MNMRGYKHKNLWIKTAAKYALILIFLLISTSLLALLLPQEAKANEPEVPAWVHPPGFKDSKMGFGLFKLNGVMQVCALHTDFLTEENEQVGGCADLYLFVRGDYANALAQGVMPPETIQEYGLWIYIDVPEHSINSSICVAHPELSEEGLFLGNCVPLFDLLDSEPYVLNYPKWDLKPGEGSPDGEWFSI